MVLNRNGLRHPQKIFVIGFNKSGTSSLHELFKSMGKPSLHYGIGRKGDWRSGDDLKLLQTYDCFSDGEPTELDKFDRLFPGSKYILQVRDLEGWVYSRLAHRARMRINKPHLYSSSKDTETDVKAWIRRRNEFHAYVFDYFSNRPHDLLVVNFIRDPDAAQKVCRFMDSSLQPERPHMNKTPRRPRPEDHIVLLKTSLSELGVPEHEMRFDLLCPSLLSEEVRQKYPEDTGKLS